MRDLKKEIKEAAEEYISVDMSPEEARWVTWGFHAGALSPEAKEYWQNEMYSKVDIIKAFNAGYESARLKGSYKVDGTFKEDLDQYLRSIKQI